ncbi:MAG: SusD/RagB family nutrient-binding outer membrane lipoprotein [Bacteroidota bacterium]
MKKYIYLALMVFASFAVILNSCKKSELETLYPDPSKSSTATVENFLTGLFQTANEVVLPWYWRFFVVEQPTLGHYTHTMGWFNSKDQYIPPAAAMDWRWNQYYNLVTQYRVMESLYDAKDDAAKEELRIFMIAATIFFYDQTQQVIDLYGDIPWSEAGMVRTIGNLDEALPKYDDAQTIYTTMMDDLKLLAVELSTIQVPAFYAGLFTKKDFINNGDITLWRKYCNSLRLRMLMRVSDVLTTRAQTEIAEILGDPGTYPIIESNAENIMNDAGGPDMYATTSSKNGGIRSAMETWGQYDIAPYSMVKNMLDNGDPRLPVIFDPNINGEYIGMDPMDNETDQNTKLTAGLVSRYDTSSFTRNDLFPGFIITAAEVSFIKAEAIHKGYGSGSAKAAYEKGIEQSIELYFSINETGTYRTPLDKPSTGDITSYINGPGVNWDGNSDKIALIGTQKWINTGLGEMPQTWAEYRRLDAPALIFPADPTSQQTAPPVRWLYPQSEKDLNDANYQTVKAKDDLNIKIFWDIH